MLKGEKVYLRPLREEDTMSIYKGTQDQEAIYMTGTQKVFSLEEIVGAYQQFKEDDSRQDLAICLVSNHETIGDLAIMEIDYINKKGIFRIALHSSNYYGKGLGTEAVKLAQAYVFDELNLNRLELQVYSHNIRGIKSYEKAGFVKEGVLRQSLYMNNQYSDEIIMSVLQDEYRSKN
ncbi:GNAT family N-acetyltransferase [Bacillus lacus]|uniref:GNAT family N-acetyltransferase n=1 Tax=Metabacillus lacus TaxID=1983721 RepID=A0A7X2J1T0_9BACI|nr:GNAT family protein [Metabacillus lacus]MRX73878.1 GNAT family N-acetyltransferase [Metabacillus lacus]